MHILLPILLYLSLTLPTSPFSLNTSTSNWQYTASSLASTTSPDCRTAYSAPISCPDPLLVLAGTHFPNYRPSQQDLLSICADTCKNALSGYVENVGDACDMDSDVAIETLDAPDPNGQNITADKVWWVGNIIEFTWAQVCSKNAQNQYCILSSPIAPALFQTLDPPPDCDKPCAVAFFQNRNSYGPAAKRYFQDAQLKKYGVGMIQKWKEGFQKVEGCAGGKGGGGGTSSVAFSGVGAKKTGGVGGGGGGGSSGSSSVAVTTSTISTATGTGTGTTSSAVAATTSPASSSPNEGGRLWTARVLGGVCLALMVGVAVVR